MVLALAAILAGCKPKPQPPPPPEVEVLTVEPTNVPIFEEWIGTLDGFVNAQIRAQVTGYLRSQNYTEGSEVHKGDLLFEIDPRPFRAALDQALGKLAQDQAQQGRTEEDVKRYAPLAKEQAISQEQLDDAVQANLAAKAQLQADQAAVETAQFNLGFTRITAPIDGLAGIALAQIGDLVSPSSGALTTVSTINPIKVYFQISEQSYLEFWLRRDLGGAGTNIDLRLILSNGSTYSEPGHVLFADRSVNPNTGTLQIVGAFPNPKFILRPGQYGRVRAQTRVAEGAFVLPQRAVAEVQGAFQVTTVTDTNNTHVAHIQPVKVGSQIGSDWIIESGLKRGDRVIVEGILKVTRDGTPVTPKPWTPPKSADAASQSDAATQ